MGSVIFRFSIVWLVLHIILFFIERYRYKHSNSPWLFYEPKMLGFTICVLSIDVTFLIIGILISIGYWIFQPIIN